MEIKDLTSLPEQLQVVFVSGYLGYCIAYAGYRENERTQDVLYGVLAFGIFGYVFYDVTRKYFVSFLIPGLGALVVSVLVAMLWRKYGKRWFNCVLHKAAISNEDGIRTTWTRIIQDTTIAPRQIVVYLKDGTVLECDDVQSFGEAPIPLYYTDSEGNIALYVTTKTVKDCEPKEVEHVRHDWGDKLTYIPKDQVASVQIRFQKI